MRQYGSTPIDRLHATHAYFIVAKGECTFSGKTPLAERLIWGHEETGPHLV